MNQNRTDKLYERAQQRVNNSPKLSRYSDIIFADWRNWDEHLQWVCTATVSEIADWAESIRAEEAE